MAAREFVVRLINETPFRLVRRNFDDMEGQWGVEPDLEIEPNGGEAIWRGDSDGWFRGVEGWVDYQIQDGDQSLGPDSHKGTQGCLNLHWTNPYVGPPHTEGGFRACEGLLASGSPGSDYKIYGTNVRPGEDPAGPISTDGWIDFVPGLVPIFPFPDGHLSHVWTAWRLRLTPVAASALSTVSGPHGLTVTDPLPTEAPVELKVIKSAKPVEWAGRWADVRMGQTTIRVDISGAADPEALYVRLRDPASGVDSVTSSVIPRAVVAERYTGDHVAEVVTIASPVSQIRPQLGREAVHELNPAAGIKETPATASLTWPRTIPPIDLEIGEELLNLSLDDGVDLYLYGDFNPSGTLVNYRVRCMKRSPDVSRPTDLMLVPYTVIA